MNDIIEVKKMLEALLRGKNSIHWVGGWVAGRTSNDDPFVILYPAGEYLEHKVCRVYEHDFKKLPDFIPTGNLPADTESNPDKSKAVKMGIFHECPMFKIATYQGKETQMGPEVRFSDVLYVTQARPAAPPANGNTNASAISKEKHHSPEADSMLVDCRAWLENKITDGRTTLGMVIDAAAMTKLFENTPAIMEEIKKFKGWPKSYKYTRDQVLKGKSALAIYDWLVERKAD